MAYHDLNDNAESFPLGAQIEILQMKLRQYEGNHWQLQQLAPSQHWVQALCDLNVNTERRACRLQPKALSYMWQGDTLELQFALPTGCFATSVLRELLQYQDLGREQVMLEC